MKEPQQKGIKATIIGAIIFSGIAILRPVSWLVIDIVQHSYTTTSGIWSEIIVHLIGGAVGGAILFGVPTWLWLVAADWSSKRRGAGRRRD